MEISLLNPILNSKKKSSSIHKKKNPVSHECEIMDSYLLNDINNAKKDIETILLHLDYQTDPDLIDSYSYQLKGAYMRYRFLLRQIQQTTNCQTFYKVKNTPAFLLRDVHYIISSHPCSAPGHFIICRISLHIYSMFHKHHLSYKVLLCNHPAQLLKYAPYHQTLLWQLQQ